MTPLGNFGPAGAGSKFQNNLREAVPLSAIFLPHAADT